jgi:gluconokinase
MVIVLMGVSGSGKSVVGAVVSNILGYAFHDGDEFHPPANVKKMASGTPLTDADRWPWLDAIGAALKPEATGGTPTIIACSALKRVYRERIAAAAGRPVAFVLLDGDYETLKERMAGRKGHFMPTSLLDSQLATLEKPGPDEWAATVSVEPPIDVVARAVIDGLARLAAKAPA